jgi:hypothetical protein
VKIVSYMKARTQEPEDEPCWLISASPLDDVASGMHALIKRIIRKIKGGYCPESMWSPPLCRA